MKPLLEVFRYVLVFCSFDILNQPRAPKLAKAATPKPPEVTVTPKQDKDAVVPAATKKPVSLRTPAPKLATAVAKKQPVAIVVTPTKPAAKKPATMRTPAPKLATVVAKKQPVATVKNKNAVAPGAKKTASMRTLAPKLATALAPKQPVAFEVERAEITVIPEEKDTVEQPEVTVIPEEKDTVEQPEVTVIPEEKKGTAEPADVTVTFEEMMDVVEKDAVELADITVAFDEIIEPAEVTVKSEEKKDAVEQAEVTVIPEEKKDTVAAAEDSARTAPPCVMRKPQRAQQHVSEVKTLPGDVRSKEPLSKIDGPRTWQPEVRKRHAHKKTSGPCRVHPTNYEHLTALLSGSDNVQASEATAKREKKHVSFDDEVEVISWSLLDQEKKHRSCVEAATCGWYDHSILDSTMALRASARRVLEYLALEAELSKALYHGSCNYERYSNGTGDCYQQFLHHGAAVQRFAKLALRAKPELGAKVNALLTPRPRDEKFCHLPRW
eukprot:TRINITY_DN4230_c0_g1_i1.p1 TRINITY_DN4230_c0_g1~~TRINITY_DN4230_c0_g1_i1.p1  ORF type:complete len:495 (-),score=114.38 TRINITY_DN4230_c0_g1_i1:555-2039(-)